MTTGTEETGFTQEEYAEVQPRVVKKRRSHYTVRRMTESGSDPVIFSHEDKAVAQNYVKAHHPRGREVYVESPDGYREHYSAEHEFQGSDPWLPLEEEEE